MSSSLTTISSTHLVPDQETKKSSTCEYPHLSHIIDDADSLI